MLTKISVIKLVLTTLISGVFASGAAAQVASGNEGLIPILSTNVFDKQYEPTCLSNGFVGFRPRINPLSPTPVAVSGEVKGFNRLSYICILADRLDDVISTTILQL